METLKQTIPCQKCNRQIIALNFVLHQLRCHEINKLQKISNTANIVDFEINEQSEDAQIEKKTCPKCSKDILTFIYSIHFKNCNIKPEVQQLEKVQHRQIQPLDKPEISLQKNLKINTIVQDISIMQNLLHNCIRCGQKIRMNQIQEHIENCVSLDIKCEYCHEDFPESFLQEHIEQCQTKMVLFKKSIQSQIKESKENQSDNSFQSSEQQQDIFPQWFGLIGKSIKILYQVMLNNFEIDQSEGLSKEELRKLNKIKYLKNTVQIDQCSICFVQFQERQQLNQLNCRHLYHNECISQWLSLNSLCPVCKRDARQKNS